MLQRAVIGGNKSTIYISVYARGSKLSQYIHCVYIHTTFT